MQQDKYFDNTVSQQKCSSDVMAFCSLVARILMRCLRERDPHVTEQLFSSVEQEKGEPKNDATT